MQAMPHVPDDHLVLVLYGDVPLVQLDTLARLVAAAGPDAVSLLSVMLPDPTGYGRIVRDGAGNVVRIVEHKDANAKERAIHESNTGLMCVPAGRLKGWLAALRNDNAQGEYYLTDIIVVAVKSGCQVHAVVAPTVTEVLGVNDKVQLAELEAAYRRQRATALMLEGVTIVDPARFDARGPVSVGRDVHIDVNVVLEGTREARPPRAHRPERRDPRQRHRRRRRDPRQLRDRPRRGRCALDRRPVRAAATRGEAARGRARRQLRRGEEVRAASAAPRPTTSPISATRPSARRSTSAPAPSPATTTA